MNTVLSCIGVIVAAGFLLAILGISHFMFIYLPKQEAEELTP